VADTGTQMPGTTNNFSSFGLRPALDNGDVVFRGSKVFGGALSGVFTRINGVLGVVATTATPIPGGTGNFASFEGTSISNGHAAFIGIGSNGQTGVYASSAAGLVRVADRNTQMPGTTSNFSSFDNLLSISDGLVAYHGTVTLGVLEGIYTDTIPPASSGPITIANTSTRIPGRSVNFTTFHPPQIDAGNISFIAENNTIVIKDIGNGLEMVADNQTPIPGGSGNFTQVGPPVASISGTDVAFGGFGTVGQVGVYVDTPMLRTVANHQTPVPGLGTNKFNTFQDVSIDAKFVVFAGGRPIVPQIVGIYTNLGEILARVVDVSQQVDGKNLLSVGLNIGSESFDDLQVVFRAQFTNGSSGVFIADFVTAPIPPTAPGDLTGDGLVNLDDVSRFTDHLVAPDATEARHCNADINVDGRVDADDIQPFICVLLGIPCP